jgi:esterase/lipase superfamily enzyme
MLVFGQAGVPLIHFPTSLGTYYQAKDFGLVESLRDLLETNYIRLYCPASFDHQSWYNRQLHPAARAYHHTLYDAMLREEIIQRACWECQVSQVALSGCSFGAYHACNLAFRYPSQVFLVCCMGGYFDVKPLLGGYYDDNVYFNNPVDFLQGLQDPALWQLKLVLGVGEHDFCRQANESLYALAQHKQLQVWLDILEGGNHDWNTWKEMFPRYLWQVLK